VLVPKDSCQPCSSFCICPVCACLCTYVCVCARVCVCVCVRAYTIDWYYKSQEEPSQNELSSQFLHRGFLESASSYCQSEAQFLWKALVQVVNNSHPYSVPPYTGYAPFTASLVIITDQIPPNTHNKQPHHSNDIPTDTHRHAASDYSKVHHASAMPTVLVERKDRSRDKLKKDGQTHSHTATAPSQTPPTASATTSSQPTPSIGTSYITKRDISIFVDRVLDSVLVAHHTPKVYLLQNVFMRKDDVNPMRYVSVLYWLLHILTTQIYTHHISCVLVGVCVYVCCVLMCAKHWRYCSHAYNPYFVYMMWYDVCIYVFICII